MSHDHANMLWRAEAVERVLDVRETALAASEEVRVGPYPVVE